MPPDEDEGRVEDWVAETPESISARLEAAKAAQAQLRLTLGTMAVISVMMLIASYNAYLSYDYQWIVRDNCTRPTPNPSPGPDDPLVSAVNPASDGLKEQAYRDWASSRTVMISLLGVRVSVDDAAVLGTAVLCVLSFWLLLVVRRENHTIGFLLRDTDTRRPDDGRGPTGSRPKMYPGGERWRIYHTIISNSLFVIFDHAPNVQSLADQSSLTAAGARRGVLNRIWLEFVRGFFFWFPVVASAAVFLVDRASYLVMRDPFDPECAYDGPTPFFWRSMLVFFACWIPLVICCVRASLYSETTEKVLREYGKTLLEDLSRKDEPAQS